MNTNQFRGQQLIVFAIALLGLYVFLGWLLHVEIMVRIVPTSVAVAPNTALLFIVAAISLWPSTQHKILRVQTIAAWILILLPCLILFEHWRNFDLGIDWISLYSIVKDGNPHPGRIASNTCLGFLFAGISFFLSRPTQENRYLQWLAALFVYATLIIGVSALIGFILKLDSMYSLASYNRMAVPTAAGISVIGLGLWLRHYQTFWSEKAERESPDQLITRTAAIILTIVALTTGLTAFAILKQGFEDSMSDAFQRTTKSNAAAFSATLDQAVILATTIASRPALQNYLFSLSQNPQDQKMLSLTKAVGQSFFASGITGIHFFNARDKALLTVGSFVKETAAMAIPLNYAGQRTTLLWQDGFLLHSEKNVLREGVVVGKFIAEQRLPALTDMLRDQQKGSVSTDILVCGRSLDDAVCFPSRFYPANLHIPMYKDGKPYLAISRALLNQRGVMTVKDVRGIEVLAGYAPIGNVGMGLVLKTDIVELYSPIRSRLNLIAVFLAILIAGGTLILRTQVHPLAQRLVKDRRRMEVILESSHEAFIGMDQGGTITEWNLQAERTFGWSRAEVIGKSLAEVIIPPALRDAHHQGFKRFMKTGKGPVIGKRIELPAMHRNGGKFLVEITISAIKSDNGYSFTAFLHDISARKQAEAELFSEKERLRVTLSSIGDAVITTDTNGNITYLNPIAEIMTGWSAGEAFGLPLPKVFRILNENTGEIAQNPVESVLLTQQAVGLAEYTTLVQRNGKRFPIEDSAAPIRDKDNALIGVVLVFHDVTQARKMAAEMTHQATHDELTGLINRREFERRLEHAIQTGQANQQHSMLYLDLDQFKIVNDTCGHIAGDELLRQLTTVLQERLRKSDTLARLGGDEFGVLLESCPTEPAHRIAELLRKTVSDFHFVWVDKVFPIGVSIGLVTFSNEGVTLADILRMADAACYVAKDNGRNRIHAYTAEDKELAIRHGEMGWIGRIQKALDDKRFVLYSQQILALGDNPEAGEHYELLLRMRDEQGDIIPPMAFIPAAERYGLMPLLDRWVIETAFWQHGARHPAGTPQGTCAINLSATSICDEYFLAFVEAQFKQYNVPPSSICFEITETTAIANLSKATVLMRALKAIGCRFALDDFGSGMSSFAYLKHLPVDYLKIDGGFVKDMMSDPIDRAMVESIHHIGHVMGLKTIAEFVESQEILDALRVIGVDFAQGYAVEKPTPIL